MIAVVPAAASLATWKRRVITSFAVPFRVNGIMVGLKTTIPRLPCSASSAFITRLVPTGTPEPSVMSGLVVPLSLLRLSLLESNLIEKLLATSSPLGSSSIETSAWPPLSAVAETILIDLSSAPSGFVPLGRGSGVGTGCIGPPAVT